MSNRIEVQQRTKNSLLDSTMNVQASEKLDHSTEYRPPPVAVNPATGQKRRFVVVGRLAMLLAASIDRQEHFAGRVRSQ